MRNALIGGLIGGLVVAAGFLALGPTEQIDEADPVEVIDTALATVVVADLIETETLSGNLRFREPRTLRSDLTGTVTRLPAVGDVIRPGDVVVEVDGTPVFALVGERPAWRPFVDGMEDGVDVLQLEEELSRLGFFEAEPDEEFDADTARAIEDWRESVGLPEDDVVELGRIVFLDEPVRVGARFVETGETVTPGLPLFEITSQDQEVLLELDPDELDLVAEGMDVVVILPDEREIPGTIDEIGRAARALSPEPDSAVVVEVLVAIDGAVLELDRAPVDVEVETDRAAGVLAVPVRALVSLSGGGYALEVDRGGGVTELVGVEIGEFAEGLVEVTGAIVEGDQVVIPR